MKKPFDLNCAPIDQYPVTKILTKSDMTTSQLVLPRHPVEEFIIPKMPENLRNRLIGNGRANVWIVDDKNRLQHFLTMTDNNYRYGIISWGHVRQARELREGQEIRFGWMDHKLHFIVTPEDKNDEYEVSSKMEKNSEKKGEQEEEEHRDEPSAKKRKIQECFIPNQSLKRNYFQLPNKELSYLHDRL